MPRLDDDGHTITLDLHGARVPDAEDLAEAVVQEAARRGRTTVRLIHGVSTSEHGVQTQTIKTALRDMLDDGVFDPYITSSFQAEGHLLLGLSPHSQPVAARLTLRDFW